MERPILVAELGRGGMADVFLAMRRGLGGFVKLVVIKRLRDGAVEGDVLAMFHDEARISARLNHPNVVQTHEVGFDGEHLRLEMEFLDGQPLHRIVTRAKKAKRPLSQRMVVAVVRDVLAGLHYAHELADYDGSPLGIVHRDVSPQNIFVTYDGRVKLVDFGIAKAAGQIAITSVGTVKGKVRYMAPEQATGKGLDRRADLFAVGVVLWQLLVGRGYWAEMDDMAVFRALALGELPPRPRAVSPVVPEALDAICARALAPDPADRFATAEEFRHALEACVDARGGERELGELAAELFVDVRQAIRAEIEKAAARPVDADEAPTLLYTWSGSSSETAAQPAAPPTHASTEPSDRPVSGAVRLEPRRSASLAIAGWSLAACFAVVSVAAVLRVMASADARRAPDVPRPSVEVAPSAPFSIVPTASSVVVVEPAGASQRPTPWRDVRAPGRRVTMEKDAGSAFVDPKVEAKSERAERREEPATETRKLRLEREDPWDAGAPRSVRAP
jgi:eukaryotic-like serine/threonine-protein kinase